MAGHGVAHIGNHRTLEAEAGVLPQIQTQLRLHKETVPQNERKRR